VGSAERKTGLSGPMRGTLSTAKSSGSLPVVSGQLNSSEEFRLL
jgi:hypothetical protein